MNPFWSNFTLPSWLILNTYRKVAPSNYVVCYKLNSIQHYFLILFSSHFFTFLNAVIKRMSNSIMHDQFTINLSSNATLNVYKSNTLASFRTILSSPLELEGSWEVGVTKMTYPRQIYNIWDFCFDFFIMERSLVWKNVKLEKAYTIAWTIFWKKWLEPFTGRGVFGIRKNFTSISAGRWMSKANLN